MTSTSVIKTKLFPPVSRSSLVQRYRLLKMLEENRNRKLTLVAAPAGFGKTTILGQWFNDLQEGGERGCWCSLDHEDNNPNRFLRHIISALRTCSDIGVDVIRQLDTTLIPDISDILPTLVNELIDSQENITLIVDDFHYISSVQINQFIEVLINLSPSNFHLILSSRIRPPLALSSLRVHNELCEITANHLRFDTDEAKGFMCDIIGLDLSNEQLNNLYEHSEGWAAGLQLASLSLHDPSRRDQFIASFSGSLRDIADYLASDVLNQQTPEIRDFLLRTSILERLCQGACNALTKQESGQELLEKIETRNLFLVPLDDSSEWYRYHHLFQEFLRTQLRKTYPEEMVSLYKNASDWFSANGHINEAVNYALLSGDMNKVGHLIHTGTMEKLSMEGRMGELLSWVNSIPQNIKTKFPRLLIQECIALSHLCRPVEATGVAEQAEIAIKELGSASDYQYTESELIQIQAEATMLPFMVAFCKDDIKDMVVTTEQAKTMTDNLIIGMDCNFRGYSYIEQCRLNEAHEHLTKARFHHVKQGSYYGAVFSDCFITSAFLLQYKLKNAFKHAQAAEQLINNLSGGHVAGMAKAKVSKAIVIYEWNQIDEAIELLESYLPSIEDAGQISITQRGFITLARCYAAKMQFDLAYKTLERCLLLSQHTNRDYINLVVDLEKLKLQDINTTDSKEYNWCQVENLVANLDKKWHRVKFMQLLILINSCLPKKEYDIFQNSFYRVERLLDSKKLTYFCIKLKLLKTIVNMRTNNVEAASSTLEEVIELVCPQNGIRIVLDAGPEIVSPLQELRRSYSDNGDTIKLNFINKILNSTPYMLENQYELTNAADTSNHESTSSLIEPVSDREIQILELLAKGESNAKISTTLLISENTVKWHMKNVFAKLGVSNRTGAVVIAQQHGLIN